MEHIIEAARSTTIIIVNRFKICNT